MIEIIEHIMHNVQHNLPLDINSFTQSQEIACILDLNGWHGFQSPMEILCQLQKHKILGQDNILVKSETVKNI
jgi:hypothetical protein